MTSPAEALEALRAPFPDATIGKLPKLTCSDCSKKQCQRHNKQKCQVCGNYLSTAHIHIDYVGHAETTNRLLLVDPTWTWEPVTYENGRPALERDSSGYPVGLWIKLTVCGVTRLGYGSVEGKKSDAIKELIGDAIRNAAMRFGVALDLWAKGELEANIADAAVGDVPGPSSSPEPPQAHDADGVKVISADQAKVIAALFETIPVELDGVKVRARAKQDFLKAFDIAKPAMLPDAGFKAAQQWIMQRAAEFAPAGDPPSPPAEAGPEASPPSASGPATPSRDELIAGIRNELDLADEAFKAEFRDYIDHTLSFPGTELEDLDDAALAHMWAWLHEPAGGS